MYFVQLTQINLLKQHYHVSESILVVDREEAQNGQKLVETLNEIKIPLVERMVTAGYNGMMAEPQNTKVPFETLYKIKDWLLAQNPKQQSTSLSIENFNNANIAQCTKEDISETICFDPESHLMGILCQSLSARRKEHLIIFTNSGAVHRVGPNRIYTELTRALAQAGFPNVRFDMSNLGDSFNGVSQEENDPYPAGSTQDITLFIDFMQRQHGFKTISLAGLCSGAHNSFHTALESPDLKSLKEIILINPLAFYRRKGAEIFNASNQELARDAEQERAPHDSLYGRDANRHTQQICRSAHPLVYLAQQRRCLGKGRAYRVAPLELPHGVGQQCGARLPLHLDRTAGDGLWR